MKLPLPVLLTLLLVSAPPRAASTETTAIPDQYPHVVLTNGVIETVAFLAEQLRGQLPTGDPRHELVEQIVAEADKRL